VSASAEIRLEVQDVSFSYGPGRFHLDGVSLTARPGEVVGLLGPNGSGKSTLIRLVMRLLRCDSGRVLVDGRSVADWSSREFARRVAHVPQQTRAAFAFTALETVLMGRNPYQGAMGFESEADHRVARQALERVDAERFADVLLDELSGGERQRVILARALAQEADLLVLDEPASFLDIRHQYSLYHLLRDLAHDEGRTCLAAGHDVNVLAAYCDRLVLLSEGRVVGDGPPQEVLTEARLREVYGVEAEVLTRDDGRLIVLPRVS
jgi:iron complex transport system ATP-binding protein